MPTDEPIIIYMKFIYIGDKIIRNRDDKKIRSLQSGKSWPISGSFRSGLHNTLIVKIAAQTFRPSCAARLQKERFFFQITNNYDRNDKSN